MIGIARKAGIAAAALTVGILVGMTPARADHFHDGGGHWGGGHGGDHWGGGGHWGIGFGFGGGYDPWWGYPAYYGPAYYPPPPVYYAPVYAPTYANPADAAPPEGYTSAPASQPAAPAAFDQSDCHPYQSSVVINGAAQPATGEACRQPDGTWRIVH